MTNKRALQRNFQYFTIGFIFLMLFLTGNPTAIFGQNVYQPNFFGQQPQSNNYMQNSVAFKQEIMRMEINVARGAKTLSITQVPRVSKNDVIKLKLADEAVGGIKPHQSLWDWTFLVAFVNPNRRAAVKIDGQWQSAVSQEVQFRKTGWYREYSFTVPYDSQPVFFLYPQAKNREKILKLIEKNYTEVRKLGEKTIELAGAYAQISSFLNELQGVLFLSQYSRYGANGSYGGSNSYNSYGSTYNPYGSFGNQQPQNPNIPFNYNVFIEQSIERLAKGFNLSLPSCWQNNGGQYGNYGSTYSQYGSGYGNFGNFGGYGNNQNNFGYAISQDLINRAQCVSKNIRLEDFDFSVSKLLQQGGVLAVAQLRDKYPQMAYYINLAAAAIDFIVKVFQKAPLRLVPTLVQSSDGLGFGNNAAITGNSNGGGSWGNNGYNQNNFSPGFGNTNNPNPAIPAPIKMSLYAESQPDNAQFTTAYPIITHKWQAEPDPEVISLYPPALAEPCLHIGTNVLKNTDLGKSWAEDIYARDFRLVISDKNGFRKEFPLKKNIGLAGWELNLTQEDLNQIPKVKMNIEAEVVGFRGFNEVKSQKFELPLASGGEWEVTPETKRDFVVGGKRLVTLRNSLGSCRCLQSIIYKPSFGGQFVFDVNSKDSGLYFSPDGREVSFVVDTTNFQPGAGTLEMKSYGNESQPQPVQLQPVGTPAAAKTESGLPIKLYPLPPKITGIRIAKGDKQATLMGERLEQIQTVKINGKRAVATGNSVQSVPTPTVNNVSSSPGWGGTAKPNEQPNQPIIQPVVQSAPSASERTVVFENPRELQIDKTVTLELGLEDNRTFQLPDTFPVSLSRPAIMISETREIEAEEVINVSEAKTTNYFPFSRKETFPMNTREVTVRVKNSLTDYDFKFENLAVETRIEKSQINPSELPQASFTVLDWKNLELKFALSDALRQKLGGRRIEFRIRDRERGDSDWFTIKQTFVRTAEISSIKCGGGNCEMKGEGLEFIAQVSTDGGLSWFPEAGENLQVQPTRDGQKSAQIPLLLNKKLLQIKMRDYPAVPVTNLGNFTFINNQKSVKKGNLQERKEEEE
jgi:hypothetical protein